MDEVDWWESWSWHCLFRLPKDFWFSESCKAYQETDARQCWPILIFINDLPEWIKNSTLLLFADDTKVYRKILDDSDEILLQQDLDSLVLVSWTKEWCLQFNVDKCKVVCGTYWPTSVYACCSMDMYVQIWSNCVQIWSPYLKKDVECLKKVQGRATKLVKRLKNRPYSERLLLLHTSSLVKRRMRGDLINAYRIMKGIDKVDIEHFFELDDGGGYDLHVHSLKVKVQRNRTETQTRILQLTSGLCMEQFAIFSRGVFVCQYFQEEAGWLESRCGFLKHQLLIHYIYKLQVTSWIAYRQPIGKYAYRQHFNR